MKHSMKAEHSMKSDQKGKMKNYYDSLKVSHGLPSSLASYPGCMGGESSSHVAWVRGYSFPHGL